MKETTRDEEKDDEHEEEEVGEANEITYNRKGEVSAKSISDQNPRRGHSS
jgi:hypothetical protein